MNPFSPVQGIRITGFLGTVVINSSLQNEPAAGGGNTGGSSGPLPSIAHPVWGAGGKRPQHTPELLCRTAVRFPG